MAILIDSNVTANNWNGLRLPYYTKVAQSFYTGNYKYLASTVEFKLYKGGSPTGNMYATIYELTGTPGSSALPTGSAIATSTGVDMSTLPTTSGAAVFVEFVFPSKPILGERKYYCLALETDSITDPNRVNYGSDDALPHGGNKSDYNYPNSNVWQVDSTMDVTFRVYGDYVLKAKYQPGSLGSML